MNLPSSRRPSVPPAATAAPPHLRAASSPEPAAPEPAAPKSPFPGKREGSPEATRPLDEPSAIAPLTSDATVLVVDDNATNLEVLSAALASAGVDVCVAVDGESAIEQANYAPPALILLDVTMPGLDGFETCRRLKADPATRDIPVIFTTARTASEDRVRGLQLGAVDYITKPFHQEEVLARTAIHLRLHRLTRDLELRNRQLQTLNATLEDRVADRTAALTAALEDLHASQLRLVQQEKMSSLGELVAGVAHEINNPVSFIASNLVHARSYTDTFMEILRRYQQTGPVPAAADPDAPDAAELQEDLEFVLRDFPSLLHSMQEGADRLSQLSRALRTFSRADVDRKIPFDLHASLDSTLLILKHRLKASDRRPAIQVERDYGDLPPLVGYPGQLAQVFTNLLANAIDAFEEQNASRDYQALDDCPNCLTVSTAFQPGDGPDASAETRCERPSNREGGEAIVCIRDNGPGMAPAVRDRIFDRDFTTKPVGKGTGLGLAIARQIVVENHGGRLDCESELGRGTTFTIRLPVRL